MLPPLPTLKFAPTGDWDKASRLLGKISPALKRSVVKSQELVAREIITKVKGHLRKQDLKWHALNKRYAKAKSKHNLDPRKLLAHHSYYDNITQWSRKNGWQVFIGVRKGIYGKTLTGKKASLDIATIATIHEFGRDVSKRRPLWVPTLEEMGGPEGIRERYIDRLHKQLRQKHLGKYITRLSRI